MTFLTTIRPFLLLLLASAAAAAEESPLVNAGGPGNVQLAGTEDPAARRVYIVQLRTPAAAEYFAAQQKTAGGGRRAPFSKASPNAESYAAELEKSQRALLARTAPGTTALYSYAWSLNGFAAELTPVQADKLAAQPEVLRVWEDEVRPLATNFSADFLDLFAGDDGLRGARGLDGEGVVIAVIDSGIYPEHPALQDTLEAERPRACRSSWGANSFLGRWLCRRYRRSEDRLVYDPPEDWSGECETGESFDATACNNKLIGARWFIDGALATGAIDDSELRSPRDVDGHGTHTATTAAGNRVTASIYGTRIGSIQGMAPRARIAAYKACWLRPGDQRASCNSSDLARAIDAAVADGVDVINYSVGSSMREVAAPDDLALLAATKAGIVSVVAAGNEGPNLATIGSPAGAPWVITAAASSRDGQTSLEALEIAAPASIAGRYAVREASFTPPLADRDPIEAALVLADDGSNGGNGTTSDACEPLDNADQIDGSIALIQRGGCDFDVKVANAADAGAVAALVYNIAGPPIVMNGTSGLSDIPALMLGQSDAELVLAEFDAGNEVRAVLDKGLLLSEAETGNRMGGFSARGPAPVQDVLKPDLTAPGINILAGLSPDAINRAPGERYGYLTGTSMATPHVAGVVALLREAHPEWSPAAIKSALMTTARQSIKQADGDGDAHAFDFGAGHIVPNAAFDPGLVFDAGDDDYDAFACGLQLDVVATERCDALAAAGRSFAPADLNLPSVAVSRLTSERTVRRTVTNLSDVSATFTASVESPPGMQISVVPNSLSLAPGTRADFDVTLRYESGPLDLWRFGAVRWQSNDHELRIPLAVRPSAVSAPAAITGFGGTGSAEFDVSFGYTGSYSPQVHGLRLPTVINGFVDNDPTKTFSFRSGNGVTVHLIDVPADQLYLRFAMFDALTDGNDDLDMYVYYCPDNVNCSRIGESGSPTSQEQFDQFRPPAGRYAVLIHGFETDQVNGGEGANYQLLGWTFGIVDDQGNMSVTAPSFVNAGSTETITVDWLNLASNTIYFGGISHNTPSGLSGLTLITIVN